MDLLGFSSYLGSVARVCHANDIVDLPGIVDAVVLLDDEALGLGAVDLEDAELRLGLVGP